MTNPCPVCGFLTLIQAFYGSYQVCPVCDWEDDGMRLANPACGGGANQESLMEAQATALALHPLGSPAVRGFTRSEDWRPLSVSEVAAASAESAEKHWRNKAILIPADAYWRAKRTEPTGEPEA